MILYVLAFLGLCQVFTLTVIGVGMLGYWIWARWPKRVALARATVRS